VLAKAALNFPGENSEVRHGEGVFVGYRRFETLDVPVAHPFGYGLTYTSFAYFDLAVASRGENAWTVSFTVTNTGERAGQAVVQLYTGVETDLRTGRHRGDARPPGGRRRGQAAGSRRTR
jgi:beta-glucosidase